MFFFEINDAQDSKKMALDTRKENIENYQESHFILMTNSEIHARLKPFLARRKNKRKQNLSEEILNTKTVSTSLQYLSYATIKYMELNLHKYKR